MHVLSTAPLCANGHLTISYTGYTSWLHSNRMVMSVFTTVVSLLTNFNKG